jgi:hypothetical protein
MNLLRTVLLAGGLSLFSPPLFCANISVLIVETGVQEGKSVRRSGMMEIWETGLLDVLFEEGHIVTNAQSFALKKKPGEELPGEIKSYMAEAEDAGIDYFVLAYLNYETVAIGTSADRSFEPSKPAGIEFNLFNINPVLHTSKRTWTQSIDFRREGYSVMDERAGARKAARSVIAHLGDTI